VLKGELLEVSKMLIVVLLCWVTWPVTTFAQIISGSGHSGFSAAQQTRQLLQSSPGLDTAPVLVGHAFGWPTLSSSIATLQQQLQQLGAGAGHIEVRVHADIVVPLNTSVDYIEIYRWDLFHFCSGHMA
jgi:hypothetical protein